MRGDPTAVQLNAYGPHWIAWYGRATGSYWAMPTWPGAPETLIEAPDVAALDERCSAVSVQIC